MNCGYHIEQVEGGWIVTFDERLLIGAMGAIGALQSSSRTTRYVFKDLDKMLEFLRERLSK